MIFCACMLSCFSRALLFATLWITARRAPLSMGFCSQEYWNGLPWPLPRDLPDWGIEPESFTSPALASGFFTISATWETPVLILRKLIYDNEKKKKMPKAYYAWRNSFYLGLHTLGFGNSEEWYNILLLLNTLRTFLSIWL